MSVTPAIAAYQSMDEGWYEALASLCEDPDGHDQKIGSAPFRLVRRYSNDALG